jgi:hypothetical protein
MGAWIPLMSEMDHESIRSNQIPDRYLMERLSAKERLQFEEHFLDCSICLADLESLEGLRAGLRKLSPRGAPAAKLERLGVVRLLRKHPAAALLAAAFLVAAVLPPTFYFRELRRTRGELESARSNFEAAQREKSALTQALERERSASASVASAVASIAPLSASVFTLNLTRGAGTGAPDNGIVLRDGREWVILLLDRPEPQQFESYRARISTADRHPIGNALTASAASGDMLAVGLPPGLLSAGDYVLTLEGLGTGPARDLATYRFRAVPRK